MSTSFTKKITDFFIALSTAVTLYSATSAHASDLTSVQSQNLASQTTNTLAYAPAKKPKIYIVEQSLPDFLRHAARRNGYEITMTSRVRGTLKNMSLPLNIEEMLKKIAPQFDLKWHFQQKQLYVSVGSENSTRMIFLGETDMEDLKKAISGSGLKSQAHDLNFVEDSNSVIVNGSVSYIASVELIAEALNKNKKIKKDKLKIIRFGTVSKN